MDIILSDSSDGFGKGGTQSAGGAGGAAGRQPAGSDGAKYDGGEGTGGGGGGGYYGGGGAGGYYAMGGGGSGYIHPTLTNTASFTGQPGHPDHKVSVDDPANPGTKPASLVIVDMEVCQMVEGMELSYSKSFNNS